jgi:pyridoxal phosphate enzyme (YggS family)
MGDCWLVGPSFNHRIVADAFQFDCRVGMLKPTEIAPGLNERLTKVRETIADVARRCGREPKEITLVAVSKTHPVAILREALAAGATDFGENRVQEAESKIPALDNQDARWHLIGHLQANKARRAVKLFVLVHTVDSASLAYRLDRSCAEEDRSELPVLIQVDLAGEAAKSGVTPAGVTELVGIVNQCSRLRLRGLMTLPPFFEDPERVRPFFSRLRELRDQIQRTGNFGEQMGELSMGMSHDFEVAIEEGATIVRVGTAIFGERNA